MQDSYLPNQDNVIQTAHRIAKLSKCSHQDTMVQDLQKLILALYQNEDLWKIFVQEASNPEFFDGSREAKDLDDFNFSGWEEFFAEEIDKFWEVDIFLGEGQPLDSFHDPILSIIAVISDLSVKDLDHEGNVYYDQILGHKFTQTFQTLYDDILQILAYMFAREVVHYHYANKKYKM